MAWQAQLAAAHPASPDTMHFVVYAGGGGGGGGGDGYHNNNLGNPGEPQLRMRELDYDSEDEAARRKPRKKKSSGGGGAKRRTARLATA